MLRSCCLVLLTPLLAFGQAGFDGMVVDPSGRGIGGAVVIASGAGVDRSDTTKADGTFHLKTAGAFVSVRHQGFAPGLFRIAGFPAPHRIQLSFAQQVMLELPACKALPGHGRQWIGGELRLKPSGSSRGPERQGEVTHWYVKSGKSTLHIVDGDAANAGLPPEDVLENSGRPGLRAWSFHGMVGLEFKGQLSDGRWWRWSGTPNGGAIEYLGATPEEAAKFDSMFNFACYAATQLERR